jgi:hypothetical protein
MPIRLTSSCAGLLAGALLTIACAEDAEPEARFCGGLVSSCDADRTMCENVLLLDELDYPDCLDQRAEFLDCLADQQLACPDTSTVYAGATDVSGRPYSVDGYTAWAPLDCQFLGDDWNRCRMCGADDSRPPSEAPPGSYLSSCWDCFMQGSEVWCTCSDATGESIDFIDVCSCPLDIANCDGELTCGGCD